MAMPPAVLPGCPPTAIDPRLSWAAPPRDGILTEKLALPALPPSADPYEASQACRLAFLRGLMEALRQSGAVPTAAGETACLAAGRFFDESLAARRAGFEQADGLTASKITLVYDDQLDLEIFLGEMAKRLGEVCSATLWRLYLRFATLLRRPELQAADLPAGPLAVCQGLGEMCAEMGGGIARWAPLLERIEKTLTGELPTLYGELNGILAQHGVEPAQTVSPPVVRAAAAGTGRAPEGADAASALQAALRDWRREAPADAAPATGPTTAVPVEMLNQLLTRLDALEHLDPQPPAADAPPPRLADALQAGRLGLSGDRPEALAIDALSLIFEAIFAESHLPDAVKAAIASLQIPILKTAIVDGGFFTAAHHPARRLLDRMAYAALGLPRQAGPEAPVCARLREIAARVRQGSDGAAHPFATAVAEVEAVIAERRDETDRLAGAYLPLVQALGLRRRAGRQAKAALAPLIADDTPTAIADFLESIWYRHLRALWLEGGEGGPAWAEALDLARDLVWSVAPKLTPDDRMRLTQRVPALLRGLNAGLDRQKIGPDERQAFLDACFALQTAALRAGDPARPAAPPRPKAGDADAPQLEAFAGKGLTLRLVDLPGRVPGAGLIANPPWRIGSWIELRQPGKEPVCGRLCSLSDEGWPLFANPDWPYALLVSPLVLDHQLKRGEATVRGEASLFDAAAAKALRLLASRR